MGKAESDARIPFETCLLELNELRKPLLGFRELLKDQDNKEDALASILATTLAEQVLRLPSPVQESADFREIFDMIRRSSVAEDILWMTDVISAHAETDEQLESEKVLIEERGESPYYLVGPELFSMLKMSRSLGIIPFELLRKLSDAKIAVIGASAAQSLLLLLSAMGAGAGKGYIRIADPGITKPSTLAKGIGSPSFARNLGKSKAELVVEAMQSHDPYGSYEYSGNPVKLIDTQGKVDLSYFSNADVVIEIVDDAETKLRVQDELTTALKTQREGRMSADVQLPQYILRIADVGDDPFVEVRHMESEERFGRTLTPEEQLFATAFLSGKLPPQANLSMHAVIAKDFIAHSPDTFLGVLASPSRSFPQTAGAGLSAAAKSVQALLSIFHSGTETSSLASEVKSTYGLDDQQSCDILSRLFGAVTGGVSSINFKK